MKNDANKIHKTYRELYFPYTKFLVKLLITIVVTNFYKINIFMKPINYSFRLKKKIAPSVKLLRDIRILSIFTFNCQI